MPSIPKTAHAQNKDGSLKKRLLIERCVSGLEGANKTIFWYVIWLNVILRYTKFRYSRTDEYSRMVCRANCFKNSSGWIFSELATSSWNSKNWITLWMDWFIMMHTYLCGSTKLHKLHKRHKRYHKRHKRYHKRHHKRHKRYHKRHKRSKNGSR
jgi:hypothetical protein